jgi:ATP-binding cassette subfamily C protein
MTGSYTFKTLFTQVRAQKSDFWRTNLYGILATLLLLPIPMLIPLLIDEILLNHPGKMTEMISRFFTTPATWVYIAVILVVVLSLRVLAFFFNNRKTYYATKITQKISYQLRHRILNHLEGVSPCRI